MLFNRVGHSLHRRSERHGAQSEWRAQALLRRAGTAGPVVAGAAFAIAWTSRIGPTLGGVLTLAGAQGELPYGALLLSVYALGLAIPFLAPALGFSRATTAFAALGRHYRAISPRAEPYRSRWVC